MAGTANPNFATHLAVELRLPISEAEALETVLKKTRDFVEKKVLFGKEPETRELALAGLKKLLDRLANRQPAWEPAVESEREGL